MIRLEPISPENFEAVIALQAALEQSKFVASNLYSIAQEKVYPECVALAAFDNDQAVGFAMYCLWRDPPGERVWLDRLLIDARYQHRGLGRAALEGLIHRLYAEYGNRDIYLSVMADNRAATALYESFGFALNGELDIHGELVMVKRFTMGTK